MVAQLKPQPERLVLLYQPDRPGYDQRVTQGWRRFWTRERGISVYRDTRRHEDDERGARIQRGIALYSFGHIDRKTLAEMLWVTERTAQSVIAGRSWGSYGQPVRRALTRLGITIGRASPDSLIRNRELRAASQAVMRRCIDAVSGFPPMPTEREQLLSDLRLLTIAPGDDA